MLFIDFKNKQTMTCPCQKKKVFLLTLPIIVASGERSFSKLKLIKNYLRSSMSQDRLVGLAMISIEYDILNEIDCESVIKEFAEAKACKIIFS